MNRHIGWLLLAGYIGTIIAANWAIQRYGMVAVGFGLVAPAGVWFAGLAFTCRDLVQDTLGKGWVIGAILLGAALSWVISPAFAVASGAAFLLSELLDLAVYTPLRERNWLVAVAASNVVGFVADSLLFLWLAFGSVAAVWGLLVGKLWMTVAAVLVLGWYRRWQSVT